MGTTLRSRKATDVIAVAASVENCASERGCVLAARSIAAITTASTVAPVTIATVAAVGGDRPEAGVTVSVPISIGHDDLVWRWRRRVVRVDHLRSDDDGRFRSGVVLVANRLRSGRWGVIGRLGRRSVVAGLWRWSVVDGLGLRLWGVRGLRLRGVGGLRGRWRDTLDESALLGLGLCLLAVRDADIVHQLKGEEGSPL
jgi:hypothetical protein